MQARHDGVLLLTLNRPDRRNALSPELYEELLSVLHLASVDAEVGAVVLTGAGGAFCSGGDITRMAKGGMETLSVEDRVARLRWRTGICELLHEMVKPTIAMIRGPAVGAGLSIALACDLRFGDPTARMKTGFLQVGVSGDFGCHYFLPRIVGMAKARELFLTSPMLDAQTALSLGLLNQLIEADALAGVVTAVAQQLAAGPRTAIAQMKYNMNQGLHASLGSMLDAESMRHVRCTDTLDHREATAAYVERRKPRFGKDSKDQ